MYKIDTFEQFIYFIENNNLKQHQIEALVHKTINVIVFTEISKKFSKPELIKDLKVYWNKWSEKPKNQRPFMLIDPLDN